MKHYIALLVMLFISCTALAQEPKYAPERFGLGIELGAPSGIAGLVITPSGNLYDFLVSWNAQNDVLAQGHYDFRLATLSQTKATQVGLYGGPGLFLGKISGYNTMLGLSGNFGIDVMWQKRLNFLLDVSPKIGIIPSTNLAFTSGVGFRFIF